MDYNVDHLNVDIQPRDPSVIYQITLPAKHGNLWLFRITEGGRTIDGLRYTPDRKYLVPYGPLGRAVLNRNIKGVLP
jgi:hypothetical protein